MDDGKVQRALARVIKTITAAFARAEKEASAVVLAGREKRLSGASISA